MKNVQINRLIGFPKKKDTGGQGKVFQINKSEVTEQILKKLRRMRADMTRGFKESNERNKIEMK